MSISPIFENCFSGHIEEVQKILEADPTQLDVKLVLPFPQSDKSATLTPLFLAALSGQTDVAAMLIEKGASLQSDTGEDLFTWTCLCPREDKTGLLDLIFKEEIRPRIHPDLPPVYRSLFTNYLRLDSKQIIQPLVESTYPLSPYNTTVFNGQHLALPPYSPFIVSSPFRGMNSLELSTYRVALYSLLKSHQFDLTPSDTDPKLLLLALQLGDLKAVEFFVTQNGGNPTELLSAELYDGMTPAYIAARYGRVNLLEYLNAHNVNLSQSLASDFKKGMTPAYAAASHIHVEAIRCLKKCGVDLSEALASGDYEGWTSAYFAARQGNVKVLEILKECGVDLSKALGSGKDEGETPAFTAAEKGHVKVLKYLKEECGVDLSQPLQSGTWKGCTLAGVAASFGQVEVIKYLRECGIDLSEASNGHTPAYTAAECNEVKVLKILKEYGVDLSQPLESGETPVFVAAQNGRIEAIKYLGTCGINLSEPLASGEYEGVTPAYIAAANGYVEILEFLEASGVDLSKPLASGDCEGRTLAYAAAAKDRVEILEFLRKCGVDLSKPLASGDYEGETPAYTAVRNNEIEVIKYLGECGVNLFYALNFNEGGLSLIDSVLCYKGPRLGLCDTKERDQIESIKFLIKHGINREKALDKVKTRRPRLYQELLTESEILLERVLLNKNFLMRVLARQVTVPQETGQIIWTQGHTVKEIDPHLVANLIMGTIDSVLSKNEMSQTLLPAIVTKFEQILATAHDQFTKYSLPMSEEECQFLCSLLETLEQVSHDLTMPQCESSLGATEEPPKLAWRSISSSDSSVRKRSRAASLPPQQISAMSSTQTGVKVPVTGKRKEPAGLTPSSHVKRSAIQIQKDA